MNIAFGFIVLGIDIHAGLPMFWTMLEGPPAIVMGVAIAVLNRSVRSEVVATTRG
jgi:hypothetical protein